MTLETVVPDSQAGKQADHARADEKQDYVQVDDGQDDRPRHHTPLTDSPDHRSKPRFSYIHQKHAVDRIFIMCSLGHVVIDLF